MTEESKDLANYDEMLAEMAQRSTQLERPSQSNIGTRAGVLTYNGAPCADNKLDVIIVASIYANKFYPEKFDSDNLTSPVCFAYSEDGENMKPHPASSKPQHENCDTCPLNQWKSDPDGGRGKACKNTRSIAVIPAGTKAADIATAEIALLVPPVTSVKPWQMYVQKLGALYNKPPMAIITQLGTVPDQKTQYKLTFKDIGLVDKSLLPGLIKLQPKAMDLCVKVYDPPAEKPAEAPEDGKAKKF